MFNVPEFTVYLRLNKYNIGNEIYCFTSTIVLHCMKDVYITTYCQYHGNHWEINR